MNGFGSSASFSHCILVMNRFYGYLVYARHCSILRALINITVLCTIGFELFFLLFPGSFGVVHPHFKDNQLLLFHGKRVSKGSFVVIPFELV